MARRIKRFFVFMFFSLFFTVSSKKIQTTNTSTDANAPARGISGKLAKIGWPLLIKDNSAEAGRAGCRVECKYERKCDEHGCEYIGQGAELSCWNNGCN